MQLVEGPDGAVILSLGVLLADFVFVAAGTLIGLLGVAAVIGLGGLVVRFAGGLA